MNERSDTLFVYGSLLHVNNEAGIFLRQNSEYLGAGKLKARLYNMGSYPGAVLNNTGDYVYGELYFLRNIEDTFKVLDEYEGFGEDELQPNEFIRSLQPIETPSGIILSWTYLYNLPVDGRSLIKSGNYKNQ